MRKASPFSLCRPTFQLEIHLADNFLFENVLLFFLVFFVPFTKQKLWEQTV